MTLGPRTEPDEELVFAAVAIDEPTFAAARRYAMRAGRVVERDGASVLGWGDAAHIELPLGLDDRSGVTAASRRLAAIRPWRDTDASLVPGPVAIGALAFDPGGWSELLVPAVQVVSRGDELQATAVGTPEQVEVALGAFPFLAGASPPTGSGVSDDEPPDRFELRSVHGHDDFRVRVARALDAIHQGAFEKVVLVREVAVDANRPLRQHHLLERLRALHPSCCSFAIDGFVGASPELLVRRRGDEVVSQPLAGTVARSGDPEEDRHLAAALLASEKERAEHRIVVDAIVHALAAHCSSLDAPTVPHLLALRNVAHLATRVTGTLRPSSDRGAGETGAPAVATALDLLAAVHPTPAVGGSPREAALDYLRKTEDVERGRFAGPVGWVRADGDGEWWIGIRSAIIDGTRARLFAGVGIVDGSDPASELAETQLKLQALLAVAVRP
ncbi:MAG TPA: isochorismate synthase [Acidimicrobiales bacterium]|nr:isochorismate synthase [Acidimicrobiales bacterium]